MKYPLKFIWTPSIETFFERNRVFLQHPIRISGVYQAGDVIRIDAPVLFERYATMAKGRFCSMGAFSYLNNPIAAGTRIGRYCSLAARVSVMGANHPTERFTTSPMTYLPRWRDFAETEFDTVFNPISFAELGSPPVIGNDVWIGSDVLLARNITIGDGAVVAARSVVTKDVPPYAIVAGVPAVQKRMRFKEDDVEALMRVRPWRFRYVDWPKNDWERPRDFCATLEDMVELGSVEVFAPPLLDLAVEISKLQ